MKSWYHFQVLAATDADADEENVPGDSGAALGAKKVTFQNITWEQCTWH